MMSVSIFFL